MLFLNEDGVTNTETYKRQIGDPKYVFNILCALRWIERSDWPQEWRAWRVSKLIATGLSAEVRIACCLVQRWKVLLKLGCTQFHYSSGTETFEQTHGRDLRYML